MGAVWGGMAAYPRVKGIGVWWGKRSTAAWKRGYAKSLVVQRVV